MANLVVKGEDKDHKSIGEIYGFSGLVSDGFAFSALEDGQENSKAGDDFDTKAPSVDALFVGLGGTGKFFWDAESFDGGDKVIDFDPEAGEALDFSALAGAPNAETANMVNGLALL